MISRRQFLRLVATSGVAGAATTGYAFAEPFLELKITRYDFTPKRWPDGFKLRIAALADLHASEPVMGIDRIRSIVDQTNALGADLIVLLGDYVCGRSVWREPLAPKDWSRALAQLRAPLGVHAILGNHEFWEDRAFQRAGTGIPFGRRALEDVGIPVYENDVVRLQKAGRPFWLAGLGDQLAFLPSRRRRRGRPIGLDDLTGTLGKVTDDAPVILLAHEPDIAPRVPERVSLILSGHTHGGQVRLFGWSPLVPSEFGNRFAYGHVREQCDIIISGGLGCSIAPVRIGVPPEIVLITLGETKAA
jgi:predicted MPP superfamily phosphohydrolase